MEKNSLYWPMAYCAQGSWVIGGGRSSGAAYRHESIVLEYPEALVQSHSKPLLYFLTPGSSFDNSRESHSVEWNSTSRSASLERSGSGWVGDTAMGLVAIIKVAHVVDPATLLVVALVQVPAFA